MVLWYRNKILTSSRKFNLIYSHSISGNQHQKWSTRLFAVHHVIVIEIYWTLFKAIAFSRHAVIAEAFMVIILREKKTNYIRNVMVTRLPSTVHVAAPIKSIHNGNICKRKGTINGSRPMVTNENKNFRNIISKLNFFFIFC